MATITELREALSTPSVSALIAKRISPRLLDYVRKEDPFEAAFPVQTWDTNVYYFNTVNRFPMAQSVVEAPPTTGAGSVTPTQSNFLQSGTGGQPNFPIQHYQVNGDISRFADKVAHASVSSLLTLEMQRAAKSLRWYRSILLMYGDATATAGSLRPQWDGVDRQIAAANRLLPVNGNGGSLLLQDLDNLIDSVRTKWAMQLAGGDFALVCSQKMLSTINRLFIANERYNQTVKMSPRRDDGVVGHPIVEVEGGIEVLSYRGIPIIPSSFITPNGAMAACSPADDSLTGTLPASAQFYTVDAITQYGPMYAAAGVSVTPTVNHGVDITITTPTVTDAFGVTLPVLQYRVYKGTSGTTMTLYGVVSATDASDAAVTVIRDSGTVLTANPGANAVTGHFLGSDTTHGNLTDFAPLAPTSGDNEVISLICRDPDAVVVPTVTDLYAQMLAPVNIRTVQYALIGDCTLAVRAPLFMSRLGNVKTV